MSPVGCVCLHYEAMALGGPRVLKTLESAVKKRGLDLRFSAPYPVVTAPRPPMDITSPQSDIVTIVVALILGALVLALIGLWLVSRWLKNLDIPKDAGFFSTLRRVPLLLVVSLDLLDLALDVFAAPVAWVFLGRYNLSALRPVTVLEALIPGTQLLPTLTVCWIVARVFRW